MFDNSFASLSTKVENLDRRERQDLQQHSNNTAPLRFPFMRKVLSVIIKNKENAYKTPEARLNVQKRRLRSLGRASQNSLIFDIFQFAIWWNNVYAFLFHANYFKAQYIIC